MNKAAIGCGLVLCGLFCLTGPVQAGTTCNGSAVQLAFGSVPSHHSQASDTSAVLNVTCSREGSPRKIIVSVGIGPSSHSGSITDRRMRLDGGADTLAYNIYRDLSMTSVWGETAGVDTVEQEVVVPNKSSVTAQFVLFGRIPPRQDVFAGRYSDSLLLRVNF